MEKKKIAIIGAGKVGSTLAIVLKKAGFTVIGVLSRSKQSAETLAKRVNCDVFVNEVDLVKQSDIVIIAVPDREIINVAQKLANSCPMDSSKTVFHTCGSQSSQSLACFSFLGVSVGSIHPLQAFSDIKLAVERMVGTYFAVDGDVNAVKIAKNIITAIGGKVIEVSADNRALYHAAACMASNYMVSVVYGAVQMLNKLGIDEQEALAALKPILQGTVDNIETNGTVKALTGPIVRGDVVTLVKHLQKIDTLSAKESDIYRQLGLYTVKIAQQQENLSTDQIEDLNNLLKK